MRHMATRLESSKRTLTREESYVDGKLTRTAFVSLAILTFITFVGNFTQLSRPPRCRRSSTNSVST